MVKKKQPQKYLVYFKERPPNVRVMRIDKINPKHKKFIKVEKYKGTLRQIQIQKNILSKITIKKPK